ncbi:MAG: hypothetical protein GF381_02875 [Candidatus Pacebacteria bacterium]|nr:hypothetical protein [Candidatus Paceibacterota bacterium]
MLVFNSLGSNYDFRFVLQALGLLLGLGSSQPAQAELKKQLVGQWSGQVELVSKGRDAIELILEQLEISQDEAVLTQAFSCYAIEEAILRTGATPVYLDLEPGKLYFTVKQLKQKLDQLKEQKIKPRAVLVQYSLGYPAPIKQIRKFCQANQLYLIEDLAQAYGAEDLNREPLGQRGDALVLSFGRDKILDAVSGGALVLKKSVDSRGSVLSGELDQPLLQTSAPTNKLLIYPFLTWLIRKTYWLGLGKLLHRLAVGLGLVASSVKSDSDYYSAMPAKLAPLVLTQLEQLADQLEHRRKLAHVYFNSLKDLGELQLPITRDEISRGANQRFPLLVSDPDKLIQYLAKNGVHLYDRWYRQPVDSGRLQLKSVYQPGSCPEAEKVAAQMVNLPTHQNLSLDQALEVSQLVKQFFEETKQ